MSPTEVKNTKRELDLANAIAANVASTFHKMEDNQKYKKKAILADVVALNPRFKKVGLQRLQSCRCLPKIGISSRITVNTEPERQTHPEEGVGSSAQDSHS